MLGQAWLPKHRAIFGSPPTKDRGFVGNLSDSDGHLIEFSSAQGSVKANGSRKGKKLKKVIKEKGSPFKASP
ncbi:hypothetical protein GOBAR_DD28672 [Gossypium barbadense]|nr:hypothetical protein GOBAR_DD28672 [Gossypium barbadense]